VFIRGKESPATLRLVLVLSPPWRTVLVLVLEKPPGSTPREPQREIRQNKIEYEYEYDERRTTNDERDARGKNSGWKARATEIATPADYRPRLA